MAWVTITNGQIDTDSPVTQPLMTAIRDNVSAAAVGDANAPITRAGWHPYNAIDVDDGADGEIYDGAVDGSVSSVSSPAFEDGYDYAFILDAVTPIASSTEFRIEAFHSGSNKRIATLAKTGSAAFSGWIEYPHCRFPLKTITASYALSDGTSDHGGIGAASFATTAAVTNARLRFDVNMDGGKIYMMRRRNYGT